MGESKQYDKLERENENKVLRKIEKESGRKYSEKKIDRESYQKK